MITFLIALILGLQEPHVISNTRVEVIDTDKGRAHEYHFTYDKNYWKSEQEAMLDMMEFFEMRLEKTNYKKLYVKKHINWFGFNSEAPGQRPRCFFCILTSQLIQYWNCNGIDAYI